ncbi:hypothetical protein Ahu01nite_093430 [Winogradskya humida]|uniref:Zinc-binding dehydrogenase n=1 Tax=Winogradskya humida TaxID=113566 RepID=A0ABQ4A5V6_9ACTN|nr:hypothetical protein Ahu01nite_093430 [Actinoplanes humidus]
MRAHWPAPSPSGPDPFTQALAIAARTEGTGRVAAAQPALLTRIQSIGRRRKGIRTSAIWGGTLKDNEVGPAVYVDFLGAALAAGTYRAAPVAVVAGEGLDKIPEALARLRKGVSAQKLVVRL